MLSRLKKIQKWACIVSLLYSCSLPIHLLANPPRLSPPLDPKSLSEKAQEAVVFIAVEKNPFDQYYGSDPESFYEYFRFIYETIWPPSFSHGSGFFISPDGYIMTNAHVIEDGTHIVAILQSKEARVCRARLIGKDLRTDLAILKVDSDTGVPFPYLTFGNSNNLRVGEQVIAIGNPLHPKLESTVTMGIVSALDRNDRNLTPIEGYIQTDTFIAGGNSGGPLLNLAGEVVGVNTWGYFFYTGYNFAVPSHTAKNIANQIISEGQISQGFLGIEIAIDKESIFDVYYFDSNDGAYIKKVFANSVAQTAGLEVGDCILQVNGYPIKSAQTLRNQLCVLAPGARVTLLLERNGAVVEVSLELQRNLCGPLGLLLSGGLFII